MTPADDELLTALRSARPDPGYRPSPYSPEATAMLSGILGARRELEHSRRVTRRRIMLAGLPALAVAVVAAVVAVSVTSSGPAPGHLSATTVRTAILDALRLRSDDILYQTTTLQISKEIGTRPLRGVDVYLGWVHPAFPAVGQQVRYRHFAYHAGKPYQDVESIYTETAALKHLTIRTTQGPRSAKIVAVDYPSRTWARFTTDSMPVDLTASPALIRAEVASGRFTVDGTVKLNGREAVKLSWVSRLGPAPTHTTLWVDSRTYVLLRLVSATPWGRGKVSTLTSTYQMRPATAARLKLLTPVIPAGFTRAATVPGFFRIGK